MTIEPLLRGVVNIFDVNGFFENFYRKELPDNQKKAVLAFLESISSSGMVTERSKCFRQKGERICEFKPTGICKQVRIFFFQQEKDIYILGGLVKKTDVQKRERKYYELVAQRQKKLKEFLQGG
jgi:phage-related protein